MTYCFGVPRIINEESEGNRIYEHLLSLYRRDIQTYLDLAIGRIAPVFNMSLDTEQDRRFSGLKGDWSRKRVSGRWRRYTRPLGRDETVCAKSERWSLEKI